MKLTLACPHCSAELELDEIAPGTRFECPGCGGECIAPGAEPAAPRMRRQLRIPARRDTAPAPVSVTVQAPQRGIFATAFRGCGVLLVMALILVVVIIGCNALVLGGGASAIGRTSAWQVDQQTPGLVNRAVGGSIMITGQGPSIVTILVNDFSPNVLGVRKCEAALVVDGREVRRDDWIGASGAMLHLDTRDDPRRAQAYLRDLLAAPDGAQAEIRFPLSTGDEGKIRFRIRGLREAAAKAGYNVP